MMDKGLFLEEEEEEVIDWLAILKEGETELEPLGSESDLSDWSDSPDDETSTPKHVFGEESREDLNLEDQKVPVNEDPVKWFRSKVQYPYWSEEQRFPVSEANYSGRVEELLERNGKLDVRTEKVTEYQLIREILWMLRNPTNSPIFELRNGQFNVTSGVTILSLTETALRSLLQEILPTFDSIYTFKTFSRQLLEPTKPAGLIPRTAEAYCSSLDNVLHTFSKDLLDIEERVAKQVIHF